MRRLWGDHEVFVGKNAGEGFQLGKRAIGREQILGKELLLGLVAGVGAGEESGLGGGAALEEGGIVKQKLEGGGGIGLG